MDIVVLLHDLLAHQGVFKELFKFAAVKPSAAIASLLVELDGGAGVHLADIVDHIQDPLQMLFNGDNVELLADLAQQRYSVVLSVSSR
jgi:hypothetical protein